MKYFYLYSPLFRLASPRLAEELNTVVGTAFRVAYADQIQSQSRQKVKVGRHNYPLLRIF